MGKHQIKNNKKRHQAKKKKKRLKLIITIVLMIVLALSITYIIKYCCDTKEANEMGKVLENIVVDTNQITETKTERMLQLEELQKENSEIIGWLEIEGTNINYPILQTTDNEFYLNHNYKKEYSAGGSLFLDKDFEFDKPSTNYLIYGHRMKNGTMFEHLFNYKDEAFYKEHPTIKFTTNQEDVEYEILAVFYSRVYYKSEKNVFRYYYFIDANNEKEYDEYVSNAKKASIYDTGVTAKYGEQLITLSTCEYSQEDGRFVVVAKKAEQN